jgi:flagellar hook assembly protein FlgD
VELPAQARVKLSIYDLRGRHLRDLFDGNLEAGVTPIEFDGTDSRGRRLSSGSYFAVLETGEFRATRRVTLVQ